MSASFVVRLECAGSGQFPPTEHDGRLLVGCDVDAINEFGTEGVIVTTDDPAEAMRFESFGDATAYVLRASTVRPLRPDGKPNRPLTAYTVTIEPGP